jgi:hypothetical protein
MKCYTKHNSKFLANLECRLQESAKHAADNLRISHLKSNGESCATCDHCKRYKYTYHCESKMKVISLYQICAMHTSSI